LLACKYVFQAQKDSKSTAAGTLTPDPIGGTYSARFTRNGPRKGCGKGVREKKRKATEETDGKGAGWGGQTCYNSSRTPLLPVSLLMRPSYRPHYVSCPSVCPGNIYAYKPSCFCDVVGPTSVSLCAVMIQIIQFTHHRNNSKRSEC